MDGVQNTITVQARELLGLVDAATDIGVVFEAAEELVEAIASECSALRKGGISHGMPINGLIWTMGELKERLDRQDAALNAIWNQAHAVGTEEAQP